MGPSATRSAVAVLDVVETPLDLRGRVGLPVVPKRRHLLAGQRLRDAERPGTAVGGLVVPATLPGEQLVEAGELINLESGVEHQRTPGLPSAAVVVAGAGDRSVV